MAGSINKVILIGNCGKDPEIRATQLGKKVASFPLATNERWRDKSTGEMKDKTEWHRISIFSDGLVNIVENYVRKGTKLYIEGALQTRKWVDNNGIERYSTDIVLQNYNSTLTLLDNKNENFDNNSSSNSSNNTEFSNNESNFSQVKEELDDEIPF